MLYWSYVQGIGLMSERSSSVQQEEVFFFFLRQHFFEHLLWHNPGGAQENPGEWLDEGGQSHCSDFSLPTSNSILIVSSRKISLRYGYCTLSQQRGSKSQQQTIKNAATSSDFLLLQNFLIWTQASLHYLSLSLHLGNGQFEIVATNKELGKSDANIRWQRSSSHRNWLGLKNVYLMYSINYSFLFTRVTLEGAVADASWWVDHYWGWIQNWIQKLQRPPIQCI